MNINGYKVDKEVIIDTLNDVVCDYVGCIVDSDNVEEWLDFLGGIYFRDDLTDDNDEFLTSDWIDIGVDTDEKIFIGLWSFEDINEDEVIEFYTKLIIKQMLTESTGKHFMDSGGAYGRHWQENQKNGIKTGKIPVYWSKNDTEKTCDIVPIIPIFDYLSKTVEYTKECQMLESLLPHLNYDIVHYIADIINNPSDYNTQLQVFEENDYLGSNVRNTYNYDTTLNQDFLYIWFTYDSDDYIAISIHNGCDIRGGYTDVHVFKVRWAEEMEMAKYEANIYCKCLMHDYRQSDPSYIRYWDWDDFINEKFIYAHSYEDEDGNLRCKYCNEIIGSYMIDI